MSGLEPETTAAGSSSRDRLLDGRVELLQPMSGYRAGVDPVLLAAAIAATPGERIADLGCGVGAAALCLLARLSEVVVVGLEIQPDLLELARQNANLNGCGDRFSVVGGDVRDLPDALQPGSFDQVVCNPPFLTAQENRPSPDPRRDIANRECGAELRDWIDAAISLVRRKGKVTLIHRADRLDAVLAALTGQAGDIAVFPFWPRHGAAAKRLVVSARKGVASPLRILSGMTLHAGDGFTPEADAVLRKGGFLDLWEKP